MTYNTMNNDVTLTGDAKPLFAGRYQVVCQLGSGGMGSVCLVEDTKLDNKLFAIKMLPAYLVANKRAYRQLQKEALVAMQLVHPNIVQIRDFVEHEGSPFLVMDYVEGQTLDDYIADKGTLTEEETVRLLKPIAAALDYAHGEGVVHRDIKPANVMIRKDGRPFILDFGIAREIQETMTRVTGKFSSGTLLYMSPEQLNGEPPSPAQDVYSFAVMAYECLKGAPPFVRGQIEHQILNNPPPPLPEGIGAALAEAVRCGLAKKKEDRPTSCCEIIGCCAGGIDSTTNNTRSLIQKTIMAFQNKDFERAFGVAQKADKNNAEIQYIIGMCYLLGNGTKMDEGAAMQWFRKAAVQGYSAAQNDLGNCYVNGRGVVKDEVEAIKWYRKAADHGYAEAQNNLGIMYWYGKGIERDDVVAASWFRKAAVQGYAEAQYNLGDFYYHGLGGLNDIVEAAKWYRKAAEQGHESAQELFCFMYSNGQGVEKDDVGAVKIVHNAAEQGHAYAQFDLGKMYYNGDGVTQNYAEAIKWYRKAAEQGDVCAQYNLGKMYSKGEGVAKNNEEAAMWLRKAAEQNHIVAQYALGLMYCNGEGVNQNHEEGVKWIHKSAVQGNKLAQQALYELVQNRQGISKNDAEQITTQRERSVRSIPKQARKTERRLELIPQTSAPPDSHFSTCRKDEYRVNGSTYVDVSSKGLWGGMLSSFFAGLNGKGVDTGWDRISGRWDAMKQDGKNHRR